MVINFVKKGPYLKVIIVIFVISFAASALYMFTNRYKKTSSDNLIMVGMYANMNPPVTSYENFKPLILSINPNPPDFSIKKVDLDPLGLNITGIHKARAFTEGGKYKLALATYSGGELVILGGDNSSLKNFKVEFEDKMADTKRARALSVGDVNGDGKDDIVIGTRPSGILKYYQFVNGKWSGSVIDEVGATIHDLLITDSDGDGKNEIFATTSTTIEDSSLPNSKTHIPEIIKYKFNGTKWDKEVVWKPKNPVLEEGFYVHARYIFSGDFDGSGHPELVAGVIGDSSLHSLMTLKWNGTGYTESSQEIDRPLPLDIDIIASGDIDNDGKNEIIIPTLAGDSIMLFKWQGNKLETHLLANNLVDENDGDQRIIAMTILDSTSSGYKNILYVTAGSLEYTTGNITATHNVTKYYILSYDSKKNVWNKKLVNTVTFTDIMSWGIFPLTPWVYNH